MPIWAWLLAIAFYMIALYNWRNTRPVSKCPPHKWEDKEGQLICGKCNELPTRLHFKKYNGMF